MDNGQKARYYAAILSEYGLWSVSTGEQFESSFLQEVILHFDSECISSQQNLKLTEVSKLICICHSLHLHSIDSKFQNWHSKCSIQTVNCRFYVWLCKILHKIYSTIIVHAYDNYRIVPCKRPWALAAHA